MPLAELWFSSGEDSLSVRRFSLRESASAPFEATIVARSPNDDLDFEALVGHPAALRLGGGPPGHEGRALSGPMVRWGGGTTSFGRRGSGPSASAWCSVRRRAERGCSGSST